MFDIKKRINELEEQVKNLSNELHQYKYLLDVIDIPTTIVANKYVVWVDKSYHKIWRWDLSNICYYFDNPYRRHKVKVKIIDDNNVAFIIKFDVYVDYYMYVEEERNKIEPDVCYYRIIKSTGNREVLSPEFISNLNEILNKDKNENENDEEEKVELPTYIVILNNLSREIRYPHSYNIHYIFERYIALNNSKFIYLRSIFETNETICDVEYADIQNTILVRYKCGTIVKFRYTDKYDWAWEYVCQI